MSSGLSPQTEQYLAEMVAGGVFSSKEAAIDAAVEALHEKYEQIPTIPPEHEALIEEAILSDDAGESREMTAEDWAELRQYAHDVAAGKITGDD